MKKTQLLKRIFAATMVLTMVGTTSAFAAPATKGIAVSSNDELIEPGTNFPVIENTPIRSSGVTWVHSAPYIHARIHVNNTTDQPMKVTITENGNYYDSFEVQPNDTRTEPYNNLPTGTIKLDFDVDDGEVEGIVAVRVSDVRF